MILPDGTTLMVDAGDNGPTGDGKLAQVPDNSKTPGEWIVRYVSHFLEEASLPKRLDYLLVSHFDNDHVGTPVATYLKGRSGKYYMTGVSYVGNYLDVGCLVDRGYPSYDYPFTGVFDTGSKGIVMNNYQEFVADGGNRVESVAAFIPGSSGQFMLKNHPGAYPGFSVRNVYANGIAWTGTGDGTRNIVPTGVSQDVLKNENLWSAVIHVNYGDFDYHSGGDILGSFTDWQNIESALAGVIGETDVFLCDHHGADDANREAMLRVARPQAFIIPAWGTGHPGAEALARMHDTSLYSGTRSVFAAGPVVDDPQITASGHVVVRVYDNGNSFQIFVLDDSSKDYGVIYQSERMSSHS